MSESKKICLCCGKEIDSEKPNELKNVSENFSGQASFLRFQFQKSS